MNKKKHDLFNYISLISPKELTQNIELKQSVELKNDPAQETEYFSQEVFSISETALNEYTQIMKDARRRGWSKK